MLKRKVASFLLLMIMISQLSVFGCAEESTASAPEKPTETPYKKAQYLDFYNPYTTLMYTPCGKFIENITHDCTKIFSGKEMKRLIYGSDLSGEEHLYGAEFLVSQGSRVDLIDAGTFIRTSGCEEQYTYLTETNCFPHYTLSDTSQFGGKTYTAKEGDLVFWFNAAGNAVNVGIITSAAPNLTVCMYNIETGPGVCNLTEESDPELLKRAEIISIEYPVYERLIFMYLYHEAGYPPSSICGILANMYIESEFLPYAEQTGGYGYGICQWTGAHRGDLESWCNRNGLDSTTLYGQLKYLKHDLRDNDPDFEKTLLENGWTIFDARRAGYLFCERYERPAADACNARGDIAAFNFYTGYGGYPYS